MMKRVLALGAVLFIGCAAGLVRADEFTAIQKSPYTYWVQPPAGYDAADYPYGAPPPPGYYGYYDNGAPVPPPPPAPPPAPVVILPHIFFGFHFR